MSIEAIGAIGAPTSATGAHCAVGAQRPGDMGQSAAASTIQIGFSFPAGQSTANNPNMSTSDFVTLTQKIAKGGKSGGLTDIMDMIKMIVALQILQKTVEATGKIIDSFMRTGESG
jgi:hypothetical protein